MSLRSSNQYLLTLVSVQNSVTNRDLITKTRALLHLNMSFSFSTHHLEVGKSFYAFGNTCNHGEIKCWVLKKCCFDTLVTLVFLDGVEAWDSIIPKSTRKEFENVQKHILTKFLLLTQSREKVTPSYFFRWDHFPLRRQPWNWLSNTRLRFKNIP